MYKKIFELGDSVVINNRVIKKLYKRECFVVGLYTNYGIKINYDSQKETPLNYSCYRILAPTLNRSYKVDYFSIEDSKILLTEKLNEI
jgi:hypothetical protein